MANLITLARLLLLFVLVASLYRAPPAWQVVEAPLLLLVIALDGVDGWVARRRRETSVFGAIFDIAVDRVVENVLWIVLGHLRLLPIGVALLFIVRGSLVDSIRYAGISRGQTPFGMMTSRLGRFLVAGRFMRGLYGAVKAATFAWVLAVRPWPTLLPELWTAWAPLAGAVTTVLVWTSVALCLLRGVPVVAEFVLAHRHELLPRRARPAPAPRPVAAMHGPAAGSGAR